MTVYIDPLYQIPDDEGDFKHARILHSGLSYDGAVVAGSTASGFYADAPKVGTTYERWKPATLLMGNSVWTMTLAGQDVDCVCIAAHTAGSSGSTLQMRIDGDLVATVTPSDDSPIMAIFRETEADEFSLTVNNSVCEVGVIRVGKMISLPQMIYGGVSPLDLSPTVETRTNQSEQGQFLGRYTTVRNLSGNFEWTDVPTDWTRDYWQLFEQSARNEPFFVAWRPDPDARSAQDVAFVTSAQFNPPQHQGGNTRDTLSFSATAWNWGV